MARVELTDKPCLACGDSLDLHLRTIRTDASDPARTAKVVRMLVCPECGFSCEDVPPPSSRKPS